MSAPALDRERLAKICGLFGSDHAGERAGAAAAADRLVRQAGLRWPDILSGLSTADRAPSARQPHGRRGRLPRLSRRPDGRPDGMGAGLRPVAQGEAWMVPDRQAARVPDRHRRACPPRRAARGEGGGVLTPIGPSRRRLPNRRAAVTETIQFAAGDGAALDLLVRYEHEAAP